jgi:tellurite resistance protein TerC
VTVPVWVWAASAAGLLVVVAAEVMLAGGSGDSGSGDSGSGDSGSGDSGSGDSGSGDSGYATRRAVRWVAVYVSLAVLFGLGVAVLAGWVAASQFYAGYLTEYSLSLDNLFIFYVIMSRLAVSPARQPRVLLFGIGLALVLRAVLIVAGLALISRFDWLFYPLGGFLVWTAVGLVTSRGPDQEEQHTRLTTWLQRHARLRGSGGPAAGPMLLVVVAIGVADVAFAFDSIPAVFGITTSAYLIVAANAFALMGLRHAYVLLARFLDRIVYLNKGLAVICAFIGVKLLLQALRGSGAGWAPEIPAWLSVTIVVAVLLVTVTAGAMNRGRPLTAAQRAALERRFAVIDTDGNGVWQRDDCEQLTRRLCRFFGYPVDSGPGQAVAAGQDALFDALLRHMDANGDREITPEEFAAGFGRRIKDRPGFDTAVRAAAQALVQVADRDGNGVLDAAEYAELTAVYGASTDEAAQAFRRLDLDRNGVLDNVEFTTAISQFFASPDADAAGSLAFGRR